MIERCEYRSLIRTSASLLALSAFLACTSCGSGKARKPTTKVDGKVFWKNDKTPATEALVIFHPITDANPESWPDGYPRGVVEADGSFKLTTYGENDGAPAGEYAVLLRWPHPAPKSEDDERPSAEDRFDGAFSNPQNPIWKAQVKTSGNDPKGFIFIIK